MWHKREAISKTVWPFISASLIYLSSNYDSLGFVGTGKDKKGAAASRSADLLRSIEDGDRDVRNFTSREIEHLGKRWEELSRLYAELRVLAQVGS